mgnify:CR=1 FL=1
MTAVMGQMFNIREMWYVLRMGIRGEMVGEDIKIGIRCFFNKLY